ncbi:expressed unknown protein [Seminavis robusta]|uniref:Uncharacterized protein n=1 Tax=Seminavis robusta TaxID=568900 RepID=A0A9N8HZM0_9STRA|nr:expressed unknown protein [Seminavis robusta]|eukprot:Sro3826_g351291.1  (180) ;mRNA; r:765-1304
MRASCDGLCSHNVVAAMTEVIDLVGEEDSPHMRVSFEVPGKPLPEKRMRMGRWGLYHPGSKEKAAFRKTVQELVPATQHGAVFPTGTPVTMEVHFWMRRPNSDFKASRRLIGILKNSVPFVRPIVPDIDNLLKFVLDGMNRLVYHDDSQVVKIVVLKLLDNEGSCEGRTQIDVYPFVMP